MIKHSLNYDFPDSHNNREYAAYLKGTLFRPHPSRAPPPPVPTSARGATCLELVTSLTCVVRTAFRKYCRFDEILNTGTTGPFLAAGGATGIFYETVAPLHVSIHALARGATWPAIPSARERISRLRSIRTPGRDSLSCECTWACKTRPSAVNRFPTRMRSNQINAHCLGQKR